MNYINSKISNHPQLSHQLTLNSLTSSEPTAPFKVIACIDMDAFYATVEMVRNGLSESDPIVVIHGRSSISVSYAARKFGVKRYGTSILMQVEEILQLCPNAVLIHVDTIKPGEQYVDPYKRDLKDKFIVRNRDTEKVNLDYYRLEAQKVISIFQKYCSVVEKASIDESFLDLTEEVNDIYSKGEYEKEWKGKFAGGAPFPAETKEDILLMIGTQLTEKIRREVSETLKYTCSAGISYNKMLAKLASSMNKPKDQTVIVKRYVETALKPIEIVNVRNFGGKIGQVFKEKGYKTLGEIQNLNLEDIQNIVKDSRSAKWIYFRCRGFDDEAVEEKDIAHKSLLANKSFAKNVSVLEDLINVVDVMLLDLASRTERFYNESGMVPSTLNLQYWDTKVNEKKTKSCPINLKIKEDKFLEVMKEKTRRLIKQVEGVLLPCKTIAIVVRNFEKNDFKSFGFDLVTYAKEKQRQKELEKDKEAEKVKEMGLEADLFRDSRSENISISHEKDWEYVNKEEIERVEGSMTNESLRKDSNNALVAEEINVKKVGCEKCGVLIVESELIDHYDFHVAEELDRELNPNKRKYRKMDSGQSVVSFQETKKVDENKGIESLSSKANKKVSNGNNKNAGKKTVNQMKSLDSFFAKK